MNKKRNFFLIPNKVLSDKRDRFELPNMTLPLAKSISQLYCALRGGGKLFERVSRKEMVRRSRSK